MNTFMVTSKYAPFQLSLYNYHKYTSDNNTDMSKMEEKKKRN